MVKNILRSAIIISLLLFSCGCATLYNPATGKNEFIFINTATEVAIGQNVAAELAKKQPVLNDKALQDRVDSVGRRLAEVSDRQDLEYKFFEIGRAHV